MLTTGVAGAVAETLTAIEQDVKGGPHAAPILTGALRRSYHWLMTGLTRGRLGNDPGIAPYAPHVEFGTVNMAAQPHLTSATEAQRAPFRLRVAAAVARAIHA